MMSKTRIELNGEWNFKAIDKYKTLPKEHTILTQWMDANVPGTVHTDLLANKSIPDPFYRTNENDLQWIDSQQWQYRKIFEAPDSILKQKHIFLVAEGLDTYAEIVCNGKYIATTANMFVEHRIDIKKYLRAGKNVLEIHFDSPTIRTKKLGKKHGALLVANDPHRVYARKAQYSFGWDWGPHLTTSGIWRNIYLEAYSDARLAHPFAKVRSVNAKEAVVDIFVEVENLSVHNVTLSACIGGRTFSVEHSLSVTENNTKFRVKIPKPDIWWPSTYGEQPMYQAVLTLTKDNEPIDSIEFSFAIRTIDVIQEKDASGKSFIVEVNGTKIFCKGANWIPSDNFIPRIPDSTYERLLHLAKDANMNILRVWGGGIYEQDIFYSLCDKLGLMVWQDFMYACGEYPQLPWFVNEAKEEAIKVVKRLRNHPSIILWCGNNECEWLFCTENPDKTADDMTGAVIFRDILPNVCKEHDGTRFYWRSSPFGDGLPNAKSNGTHHQWIVWSFWKDYKEYENVNARFVTEFGFQAPANRKTFDEVTLPEDRHPQSKVMEHHNKQVEGTERLMRFQAAHYIVGKDFDEFIYKGQLVQAEALKFAVEHWRRRKFNTAGALYWQLNDCWPVSSWAVIDSALRPKASYYYTKRFFAKILISIKANANKIEVWGINDALERFNGTLRVKVLSFRGEKYSETDKDVILKPNSSVKLLEIPASPNNTVEKYDSYVVAQLLNDGKPVSENRFFFAEPKHLHLPIPQLTCKIEEQNGLTSQLSVHTDVFAKDIRLEIDGIDAEWSDNYFDLDAEGMKIIHCTLSEPVGDIEKKIRIISLGWFQKLTFEFTNMRLS